MPLETRKLFLIYSLSAQMYVIMIFHGDLKKKGKQEIRAIKCVWFKGELKPNNQLCFCCLTLEVLDI